MNAKNRLKAFEARLRKYENSLHDPKRMRVRFVVFGENEVVPEHVHRPGVRVIDLTGRGQLDLPPVMQ